MDESNDIFTKEATVSQSPAGIVRLLILQRWDKLVTDYEQYERTPLGTTEKRRNAHKVTAGLKGILTYLKPRMKRTGKHEPLKERMEENNFDEAIDLLSQYLEEDLKLLKIDTRKEYDRTDIIGSNKHHGYT